MEPTLRDTAEFFRLGLLTKLCERSDVSRWADSIVTAGPSPHLAFVELCLAEASPKPDFLSLLNEVPGPVTDDLAVKMLFGHAARLAEAKPIDLQGMCHRLYQVGLQDVGGFLYDRLVGFDDAYDLASCGVYGTVMEADHDFSDFLADYRRFAPDLF